MSASLIALTLALTPASAPPPARSEPLSSRAIYDRTVRATVFIRVPRQGGGTGWIVDAKRRWIITNYHVASQGACEIYFPIFHNGKIVSDPRRYARKGVPGKVIDGDPMIDLSLIEVESIPEGMHALTIASEAASPGDRLHLVGNPSVSNGWFVYTSGTLRATTHSKFTMRNANQTVNVRTLETQMATNGGDSGSAVVNDHGEVVGVNFAGFTDTRAGQNGEIPIVNTYALAIALEELQLFVNDLHELHGEQARAAAHERRAARLSRKGKNDLALADLDRAIELDPKRASAYTARALLNYMRRHYDAALMDATNALELNPRDALAANVRGNAHSGRGDEARAVRDYTLALRLEPNNVIFRTNRAMSYAGRNNDDAALTELNTVLQMAPLHVAAYHERGLLYQRRKEYAKAVADFQACVRLVPNHPALLQRLAQAQYVGGQFAPAAESFTRLLQVGGPNAAAHRGLGDARFALKQYAQAIASYGEAVRLDPRDVQSWYGRGRAFEEQGDVEEAQADYARAIELNRSLERQLPLFHGRQVKITNNTAEPLRVYMSYESTGADVVLASRRRVPESGALYWTVAPGATVTLYFNDRPIEASRIRIWAEGTKTGKKFDTLKKRDLVLADRSYRAHKIDAHIHTFGE
jgi:tetratricopeptide (TPR) repeat protein